MSKYIIATKSPEEEELDKKRLELAVLEAELVKRELELGTYQAELRAFELRYLRTVGTKYAQLDKLEAQIAELLARLDSQDSAAQERAQQSQARAKESARATGEAQSDKRTDKFEADDDLKKLYREAAKKVHPDLAGDDTEREKRTKVMSEINQAYQDGDAARLRSLLEHWEGGPEAIKGDGIGIELVRIIRKIAQIRKRLDAIESELANLRRSPLAELKEKVIEYEKEGRDLLQEMADHVAEKILAAEKILSQLNERISAARDFLNSMDA